MLVILNRYVLTVPLGRTLKSWRMTGGGVSGVPVKNLLAQGIFRTGPSGVAGPGRGAGAALPMLGLVWTGRSWAATGAARTNRGSIKVRDFMVRQAPPGPPAPPTGGPRSGSDGRGKRVEGDRGNGTGRIRPGPAIPVVRAGRRFLRRPAVAGSLDIGANRINQKVAPGGALRVTQVVPAVDFTGGAGWADCRRVTHPSPWHPA